MPIYEFECEECRKVTEVIISYGTKYPHKCDCGGALKKLVSPCHFRLEGSNWPGIRSGKLPGGSIGKD